MTEFNAVGDIAEDRRESQQHPKLKDEFWVTIAHELRRPLNSILGWAQLLRTGKLDDASCRHALETIELCAKAQARLIEELLDVSQILSGKVRLDARRIPFAEIIELAVEAVRPTADTNGIEIQANLNSPNCLVYGDPKRLQQVVENLLSNAIKFTPRSGTVRLQLDHRDSQVELVVRDTGIGIKADLLPHVFDMFRQANSSSTRSHKGLGLGLAIVRQLVELHGGVVTAASDGEGQGTTFQLRLPLAVAKIETDVVPCAVEK